MTDDYNHWLSQSEMWLAELHVYGVPEAAIHDLRQNTRKALTEAQEEITRLRADLANAWAVIVEAALRLPAYDSDGDPAGQFDHQVFVRRNDLRDLSTLSPIAAAAGVLLANTEAANDPEIGPWLRAIAEQDAKPPTEYERKVAQMKKDFPNGI